MESGVVMELNRWNGERGLGLNERLYFGLFKLALENEQAGIERVGKGSVSTVEAGAALYIVRLHFGLHFLHLFADGFDFFVHGSIVTQLPNVATIKCIYFNRDT
jgi:hypothetical protein